MDSVKDQCTVTIPAQQIGPKVSGLDNNNHLFCLKASVGQEAGKRLDGQGLSSRCQNVAPFEQHGAGCPSLCVGWSGLLPTRAVRRLKASRVGFWSTREGLS